MDSQFARDLCAIARAQDDVAPLRHIEACMDCLNREVIVSASCSEATQLLSAARSSLLQVQTLLNSQSDEGAERLRNAQVAFIMERPAHPYV